MASEDPIEECHEEKMPYECFECGGDIRSLPDGMGTCDYCEKEKAQGKVKTLTNKLNMAEAREKGLQEHIRVIGGMILSPRNHTREQILSYIKATLAEATSLESERE